MKRSKIGTSPAGGGCRSWSKQLRDATEFGGACAASTRYLRIQSRPIMLVAHVPCTMINCWLCPNWATRFTYGTSPLRPQGNGSTSLLRVSRKLGEQYKTIANRSMFLITEMARTCGIVDWAKCACFSHREFRSGVGLFIKSLSFCSTGLGRSLFGHSISNPLHWPFSKHGYRWSMFITTGYIVSRHCVAIDQLIRNRRRLRKDWSVPFPLL